MMEIIPATPEELALIVPSPLPGYETVALVAVDDGVIVGHICLSKSGESVIGHSWRYEGSDPHGAVQLFLAMRQVLRAIRPDGRLTIHFTDSDTLTREFWESRGFKPSLTLYEGTI